MWSGVFALMDALPRVTARLMDHVTGRGEKSASPYAFWRGIQFLGVVVILSFLMKSFGTFVAFATGTGFITAPAIAYYNYRAVRSANVSGQYSPSRPLRIWHWTGFVSLAIFATAFAIDQLIS